MATRTRFGLTLATAVLAGCMANVPAPAPRAVATTQPPDMMSVSPGPPAPASYPPLDDPGRNPYRAPTFAELPPEAEGGRWERIAVGPQPTAPPTPTPAPTPPRLPGESTEYTPIYFPREQDLVLEVGESTQLQASPDGPQLSGPTTWGVLAPERARVSADGRLTALAAGPVHVWAEIGGRRKYMLVAVVEPNLGGRPAAPRVYWPSMNGEVTWGTFIRTQAEWDAFKAGRPPHPDAPSPAPVDFERETLVAVFVATSDDGEQAPVVTRIRRDGPTVVEVVVPDVPPGICSCDPHVVASLVAVPRLPDDAGLELVRLRETTRLDLEPPTGPTPAPTPVPSPTPTPDPLQVLPPGSPPRSAMPPYPPPSMPRMGGCPDGALSNGAYQAPLFLSWFDAPAAEPRAWEPVLTSGTAFRLFAHSYKGGLGWGMSNPLIADVEADGTVTGRHAGVAIITAEVTAGRVRALIPVMDQPAPAVRFRFRADASR